MMVVTTFLQGNHQLGLFEFDMRQCKKSKIHFELTMPMPAKRLCYEAENRDEEQKSLISHQQEIRVEILG